MELIAGTIERETEKAVLIRTQISWASSLGREVTVWFPKSQVKIVTDGIEAPDWLISRKRDELSRGGSRPFFDSAPLAG